MGAIGDAVASFAKPLIDQTDGSIEQVQKACNISMACWNLAMMPDERREEAIREMQLTLKMNDADFESFRRSVIEPMIERHQQMFSGLRERFTAPMRRDVGSTSIPAAHGKKYPGADRYGPCPCNSGKKYKFCCGK
jgi:uncharacterized protein YecA (UPF0149 family)